MAQSPNIRSSSSSSSSSSSFSFTNIIIAIISILIIIIAPTIVDAQSTTRGTTVKPTRTTTRPDKTPWVDIEEYTTNLTSGLPPKRYNKNIRPHYGEEPLVVNVSISINDISAISETSMEFKVDFYLRLTWNDHRLSYPIKHNITEVTLESDFSKKIWMPDTFFLNAKEITFHKTIAGESASGLQLKYTGDVFLSTRITLLAQCSMDLTFFPMDQQKCSIKISSYGHRVSDMIYKWVPGRHAVSISRDIQNKMPTFHLEGFNKFNANHRVSTGVFTRVQCDIYLARSIGFYISQVYVPAFLIVVISWVPFWLDQDDHHARVALGVTTVLTMTTLVTNTNSDFPKISHLKAIDIYLFVSFIMVFLSLLEYATVGFFERKRKRHQEKKQQLAAEAEERKKNPHKRNSGSDHGPAGDVSTELIPMEKLSSEEGGGGGGNNNYKNLSWRERLNNFRFNPSSAIKRTKDHPDHPIAGDDDVQANKPRLAGFTIDDVSLIDKWARRVFPLVFWVFNVLYVVMLLFLVETYQKDPEIEIEL